MSSLKIKKIYILTLHKHQTLISLPDNYNLASLFPYIYILEDTVIFRSLQIWQVEFKVALQTTIHIQCTGRDRPPSIMAKENRNSPKSSILHNCGAKFLYSRGEPAYQPTKGPLLLEFLSSQGKTSLSKAPLNG